MGEKPITAKTVINNHITEQATKFKYSDCQTDNGSIK
jgi:hypothetical protein